MSTGQTAGLWRTNVKRSTPVIGFLLMLILAFLAFGSAYGLNRGIASFLVVPESAQVVAGVADGEGSELENDEAQAAERAPGRRDYVDGILKRNIFDAEFIVGMLALKTTVHSESYKIYAR